MQFQGHKTDNYPFVIRRFITLNKTIKWGFGIAMTYVIIYEFVLKQTNAPYYFFVAFGEIFIRLSYSILSATIFYFFVQHLPKEKKKMRTFRYVHNKIQAIHHKLVKEILESVNVISPDDIFKLDEVYISSQVEHFHPFEEFTEASQTYNNWYQYYDLKIESILKNLHDLITINESIDLDVLAAIMDFEDEITIRNGRPKPQNLNEWSGYLLSLYKSSKKAYDLVWVKYGIFWTEYSKLFLKENNN